MTPDALAALHARCFAVPPPWRADSFAALLQEPQTFLCADPLGRAFALGRVIADEAELLTLATDPGARRKGLARELMDRFEAAARDRGAVVAFLEVAETNAAALALYHGCGYRPVGRRPGYYPGTGQDAAAAPVAAMILSKPLA